MVSKTMWKHVFRGIFFPTSAEGKEFTPPKAPVEGAVHVSTGTGVETPGPGMFPVRNIPLWNPPRSYYAHHPKPWAEVEKYHFCDVKMRFLDALDDLGKTTDRWERELLLSDIQEEARLAALAEYESSVLTAARFNRDDPTIGHHNDVFFQQEVSYYLHQLGELPMWW